MDLTEEHMEVLRRLRDGRVLPLADRKQDRVRQSLRRAHLIKCVMNPRRWIATEYGLKILARAEMVVA
jgi:hypothetical protein